MIKTRRGDPGQTSTFAMGGIFLLDNISQSIRTTVNQQSLVIAYGFLTLASKTSAVVDDYIYQRSRKESRTDFSPGRDQ